MIPNSKLATTESVSQTVMRTITEVAVLVSSSSVRVPWSPAGPYKGVWGFAICESAVLLYSCGILY